VAEPQRKPRSRPLPFLVGGAAVLLVAALGGAWWYSSLPEEPVSPPRPAPVVVRRAPPVPAKVPAAPPPGPTAPAVPESIELRVVTRPADAVLTLDGQPATSPLRAPRSAAARMLRATAPGHRPAEREIRFESSGEIVLELAPNAVRPVGKRPPVDRPPAKRPGKGPTKGPWEDI
jgi:hypothetical protein